MAGARSIRIVLMLSFVSGESNCRYRSCTPDVVEIDPVCSSKEFHPPFQTGWYDPILWSGSSRSTKNQRPCPDLSGQSGATSRVMRLALVPKSTPVYLTQLPTGFSLGCAPLPTSV